MAYRVCVYDAPAILSDGRRSRRFNAAAYTGIVGDTRSFLIVAPVDLMSASWVAASKVTGNLADGGVIELHAPTEKPSDVPIANFLPWVPPGG